MTSATPFSKISHGFKAAGRLTPKSTHHEKYMKGLTLEHSKMFMASYSSHRKWAGYRRRTCIPNESTGWNLAVRWTLTAEASIIVRILESGAGNVSNGVVQLGPSWPVSLASTYRHRHKTTWKSMTMESIEHLVAKSLPYLSGNPEKRILHEII